MNPRICTVKDNPPHSYGDCIRACVATLIDRDDVPHVFDGRSALESWAELRKWLKSHKKMIALFPLDEDHKEFMKENNPDVTYMLLHGTMRGDHAIICRNGEKVHDPAWYRYGEIEPHSILGCYVVGIVGDLL